MKLLLTSAGIKNASLHDALVGLLGRPVSECSALCIPTAGYGHPQGSPGGAWRFVSGQESNCPMTGLGWKSLGVLEPVVQLSWLGGKCSKRNGGVCIRSRKRYKTRGQHRKIATHHRTEKQPF